MHKKLLLDGCSFTYGLNLSREETLEQHFIECGFEVLNLSRPGKSNHAIALDLYNHHSKVDAIVVGWTFSSRWHLHYHNKDIDLLPSREMLELPHALDSGGIEQSYQQLHRSLYSLFDVRHWNQVSDMLIDSTHTLIKHKQHLFFSWEPRNTKCYVYMPHVIAQHRLPCGHLNRDGTANLFEKLISQLEK